MEDNLEIPAASVCRPLRKLHRKAELLSLSGTVQKRLRMRVTSWLPLPVRTTRLP